MHKPPDAFPGQQLAALYDIRDRWTSQLPAMIETDAERARHHAEALDDLGRLIARLEERASTADEP
jgi:hypothetical protein